MQMVHIVQMVVQIGANGAHGSKGQMVVQMVQIGANGVLGGANWSNG